MFLRGLVVFFGFCISVEPVSAHGTVHSSGDGIAFPIVIAAISILGLSGGLLAIISRIWLETSIKLDLTGQIVGFLLVAIGVTAGGSVLIQQPTTAISGIFAGAVTGAIIASRGGCELCVKGTVGAIATHRFIEGIMLSTISIAGTAVSLAGVVTLAGHMIVECIAIGFQSRFNRLQASGAIFIVTIVFVLGSSVGVIGLNIGKTVPGQLIVATTGGLLISFGISEGEFQLN